MNNQLSTTQGRRFPRWTLFAAIALLLVLVLSGCGQGGGVPMSETQFSDLGQQMVTIEQEKNLSTLEDLADKYRDDARAAEGAKDREDAGRLYFLAGYTREYRETLKRTDPRDGNYTEAQSHYASAAKSGSPYAFQANYRNGVLGALGLLGPDSVKTAKNSLSALSHTISTPARNWFFYSAPEKNYYLWVRQAEPTEDAPAKPTLYALAGYGGSASLVRSEDTAAAGSVIQQHDMAETALRQLDVVYATSGGLDEAYYKGVHAIVTGLQGLTGNKSVAVVLALFLLSVIVKVITAPLTTMAYRGMRDMQRVQPLLKELQAKYKDDRAKLAEEQMKLMKEHKVSPAGGCLPMLIQFPIFIAVYQAVRVYSYQFADTGFLWIDNLARPDIILLILYAISMIVTQKLTATPAVDPQQQALQNQMTYMMPIFLVLVLASIASAFLLYWFFLNVLSAAHQYYLIRKFKAEETAKDAAAAAAAPSAPEPPAHRRKKGMK
ncbi:MAG: YidC/Oxa1 family membrane protein insertase [Armatimonadota bacterium]